MNCITEWGRDGGNGVEGMEGGVGAESGAKGRVYWQYSTNVPLQLCMLSTVLLVSIASLGSTTMNVYPQQQSTPFILCFYRPQALLFVT